MRVRMVRHARADYEGYRTTTQSLDPPLSSEGEAQLPAIATRLASPPPSHIYCSPTLRTMATATAIAVATGLRPMAWADLCECGMLGGASGCGRHALLERFPLIDLPPEILETGWACGSTEDEEDIPQRAERVVAEVLRRHAPDSGDDVCLVTHGAFTGYLVKVLLGIQRADVRIAMHDTAVTSVRFERGLRIVESMNCVRHLGG